MEYLDRKIQEELEYIANYPFQKDDRLLTRIVSVWRNNYNIISTNTPLSDSFTINRDTIIALRNLRFGIVDESKFSSISKQGLGINGTIERRVEYGGYIDAEGISLEYRGDNGVITDFVYQENKVNYHTHPYQVDKWCYAPPSEDDLVSMLSKSIKLGKRVVCLVAAAEGIYVYYPSQELLDIINDSNLDDMRLNFQHIKILLGYVSSIAPIQKKKTKKQKGNYPDDPDDPDDQYVRTATVKKLMFGGNTPTKRSHSNGYKNPREINLNDYLSSLNLMGIHMDFYNYDYVDEIQIPKPPSDESIGGGKKYKINFTIL